MSTFLNNFFPADCVEKRDTNRRPPKGMYINVDDIASLANGNENLLTSAERKYDALRTQIQLNKQIISNLKQQMSPNEVLKEIKPLRKKAGRINLRWSDEEHLLVIQGFQKYGNNYQAIAEIIGTKSEEQIRKFHAIYRRQSFSNAGSTSSSPIITKNQNKNLSSADVVPKEQKENIKVEEVVDLDEESEAPQPKSPKKVALTKAKGPSKGSAA